MGSPRQARRPGAAPEASMWADSSAAHSAGFNRPRKERQCCSAAIHPPNEGGAKWGCCGPARSWRHRAAVMSTYPDGSLAARYAHGTVHVAAEEALTVLLIDCRGLGRTDNLCNSAFGASGQMSASSCLRRPLWVECARRTHAIAVIQCATEPSALPCYRRCGAPWNDRGGDKDCVLKLNEAN